MLKTLKQFGSLILVMVGLVFGFGMWIFMMISLGFKFVATVLLNKAYILKS